MLIALKSLHVIVRLKAPLGKEYDMKDFKAVKKILDMEIHKD